MGVVVDLLAAEVPGGDLEVSRSRLSALLPGVERGGERPPVDVDALGGLLAGIEVVRGVHEAAAQACLAGAGLAEDQELGLAEVVGVLVQALAPIGADGVEALGDDFGRGGGDGKRLNLQSAEPWEAQCSRRNQWDSLPDSAVSSE